MDDDFLAFLEQQKEFLEESLGHRILGGAYHQHYHHYHWNLMEVALLLQHRDQLQGRNLAS
jgi:hypothetical protein